MKSNTFSTSSDNQKLKTFIEFWLDGSQNIDSRDFSGRSIYVNQSLLLL